MNKTILFCGLLVSLVCTNWILFAQAHETLAKVSQISLSPRAELQFQPLSGYGFALVALQDCSILVNGKRVVFKSGSSKRIVGKENLNIAQSGPAPIALVLVTIISARQPLTIETTTLAPHQEIEDASERGDTLLIATSNLQLRDVRDLADEGDDWKSSIPETIALKSGQNAWLKSAMHRLKNLGSAPARFTTVEW